MDQLFKDLVSEMDTCTAMDAVTSGKPTLANKKEFASKAMEMAKSVVDSVATNRKKRGRQETEKISDETLSTHARFTDEIALDLFRPFLSYVPRLVNVVTVSPAIQIHDDF